MGGLVEAQRIGGLSDALPQPVVGHKRRVAFIIFDRLSTKLAILFHQGYQL